MKEIPYFKFYTGEYLTGEITVCDMETQGVFINLCCYYWNKQGSICLPIAKKRFKQNENELNNLIEMEIIKIDDDENIFIDFLDEQLNERNALHVKRVMAGRKGGVAKAKQKGSKAVAKLSNIEEKRKEEKRKEFEKFWKLYGKSVGNKEKLLKKFSALSDKDISAIMEYIPRYKDAQPDKKFRKNPESFLNNKSWNDEIISSNKNNEVIVEL